MAGYRLYWVTDGGHITGAKEFEACSDAEAIAIAEEASEGLRVELWRQARVVARLEPERRMA